MGAAGGPREGGHSRMKLPDNLDSFLLGIADPGGCPGENPRQQVLDLLERLVEVCRYEWRLPENRIPLDHFIQGTLHLRGWSLFFEQPERFRHLGSGTQPVLLQPHLLVFLLLRHRYNMSVLEVISEFVDAVRPWLTILDFKKTATGVTRAFTNTRFAANTLRDLGYLRFTKRERYKTWELSLLGVVAAARLVKNCQWGIEGPLRRPPFGLHPALYSLTLNSFDLPSFVSELESVCNPQALELRRHRAVLDEAHHVLRAYCQALRASDHPEPERRKRALAALAALDENPAADAFAHELAMYLQTEALRRESGTARPG